MGKNGRYLMRAANHSIAKRAPRLWSADQRSKEQRPLISAAKVDSAEFYVASFGELEIFSVCHTLEDSRLLTAPAPAVVQRSARPRIARFIVARVQVGSRYEGSH